MTFECNNPKELSFVVNGLTLRAWEWGDPADPVVLALHGWLDNCASFIEISKYLPGIRLIALDAAGQGQSDHRSEDSCYNIWQDVSEVIQIADQLGLPQIALVGHSRGAAISVLLAGAFPHRVSHLMLIDGLIAIPMAELDAPKQLAASINDNLAFKNRKRRSYNSMVLLAASRLVGPIPLTNEAAMLMANRGSNNDSNGYHWSFDQRLRASSELKFTLKQSKAFLAAITAKTQLYLATTAPSEDRDILEKVAAEFDSIAITLFEGSHHLHMEEQAPLIAKKIIQCLAKE